MQSNGILSYGYQMAGTSTGRFTSSKPAIHTFSSKALDSSIFTLPEEQNLSKQEIENRCDIRTLLLRGEAVVRLDFTTQENRVCAYLTENPRAAIIFIKGDDFHMLTANQLQVERPVAKVINLAPIYGMGAQALGIELKVPLSKAESLMSEFGANNPELKHFKKTLETCEAFSTPLYGRKMYLRGHMKVNGVIQGPFPCRRGSRQLHSSAVVHAAKPFRGELPLDSIADLESLITKEGFNQVFMAGWYRKYKEFSSFKVLDITQYGNDPSAMLREFWGTSPNKTIPPC